LIRTDRDLSGGVETCWNILKPLTRKSE
jgi:hypothetical protein